MAGKTFPAFPTHVQPAILRVWQATNGNAWNLVIGLITLVSLISGSPRPGIYSNLEQKWHERMLIFCSMFPQLTEPSSVVKMAAAHQMPGEHIYDGVHYMEFIPPAALDAVKNKHLRDDDVLLVTYPKAGWYGYCPACRTSLIVTRF